ncbi:MAG: NADH-quinone oxidoreductase subunit NuoK [Candidatus Hodarchaeota archaeon]
MNGLVPNIPLIWVLMLSVALLCIGAYGIMTKKSGIRMLMCVEIILNAANLNFIAFSTYGPLNGAVASSVGQVFTFFSIVVAAAEAALGLAILLLLFRHNKTIFIDQINELRG